MARYSMLPGGSERRRERTLQNADSPTIPIPNRSGILFAASLFFLAVLLVAGRVAMHGSNPRVDEVMHLQQIKAFADGRYRMVEDPKERGYSGLAMLPGYHAVCAAVVKATDASGLDDVRSINVAMSMMLFIVGFRLARQVEPHAWIERGLQLALLPLLAPYCFLVYTDVAALLALALALSGTLAGKPWLAGFALLAATLVRQNAALFIIVLGTLAWVRDVRKPYFAFRWWPLLLSPSLLGVLLLVHGRVNLDAPARHPVMLSTANVAFLLLLQILLFLPIYAASIGETARWAMGHPLKCSVAIACGVASVALFAAPHKWNQISDLLRNQITEVLTGSQAGRAMFWIGAPTAAVFAAATPMSTPGAKSWFVWSLAALLPVVLLEPRYGIPLLYVFAVFRKRTSDAAERTLVAYWYILSVASVTWVVLHPKRFF
jgi:hypothetical protein